jgi:hypothetical protein
MFNLFKSFKSALVFSPAAWRQKGEARIFKTRWDHPTIARVLSLS